jgi:serine/threonine protein kinase
MRQSKFDEHIFSPKPLRDEIPESIDQKYNKICEKLKLSSRTFKFLGEGTYGKAYLAPNKGFTDFPISSKNIVVKEVNNIDKDNKCIEDLEINAKDGSHNFYKNAVICRTRKNTIVVEYLLAQYASTISKRHFIDTYAMNHCKNKGYIFMEKIEGDLHTLKNSDKLTEDDHKIIILQLLYALHLLHTNKIMHNDPHSGNVFYIKIEDDEELSKLKGDDLVTFDFTTNENKNDDEELRIFRIPKRKIKYVIKLGDFGLASKFSEPYIISDGTLDHSEFIDYFNPTYDLLTAFSDFSSPSFLYIQIQCFLKNMNPCFLIETTKNSKEIDLYADYYSSFLESFLNDPNIICYWKKYVDHNKKSNYHTTKKSVDCYKYLKAIDVKKIREHVEDLREYLQYYRTLIYFVDEPIGGDKRMNRQNLNFNLNTLHLSDQLHQRKIDSVYEIVKQQFFQLEINNLRG